MRRKDEPEEESGGYNWMDTYGDMVTLLLCFFVLLYSFSSLNQTKWQELVSAFTGSGGGAVVKAFDVATIREDPIKIDAMINFENRSDGQEQQALVEMQEQIDGIFDELYQRILLYIEVNNLSGQMSVSRTEDVIILRFNEIALFDSGKAVIRPESEETLNHFIRIIADNIDAISMVDIEGHTDNVPINTAEFKDNWDLSAKRATNTLRILLASGLIDPEKLSVAGYGEYQPIATNDTPEGRQLNRRVDFVFNKIKVLENGEE